MPDYDPKSIPILDDIIEDESTDAAEINNEEIISEEITTDDSTLDLFNDEAAEFEIDEAEPEIAAIDKFIDDDIEAIEIDNSKTETIESALIDYPLEEDLGQETENDIPPDEITPDDSHTVDEQIDQQPSITDQPVICDPAITLDSIVDDVVTQLMPDLEQQLRSLVQQALEKKLPEEIIRQMSAENDD